VLRDAGSRDRWLRGMVFLALALFMIGGPIYRQGFGGGNILFRDWVMFRGIGLGVIEARFERLHDGQWEDFQFVDVLKRRFGVPEHRTLRLQGVEDLVRAEREMCRIYPNETLRDFARIATQSGGWVELRYLDVLRCSEILD
jgi:hypothetical protein